MFFNELSVCKIKIELENNTKKMYVSNHV